MHSLDVRRMRLLEHFEPKEAADRAYLDSHPSSPPTSSSTATTSSSTSPSTPTVVPADAAASVKDGLRAYWRLKNAESVDGLPGLEAAGFPPEQGAIRKSRKGLQSAIGDGRAAAVEEERRRVGGRRARGRARRALRRRARRCVPWQGVPVGA